jgi:uncharacterized protein (DUF885 family)
MDDAFEQLAQRYVDEAPALSPVSATWLGDHRYDGELDEVTPEARQRRAAFCRSFLDELARIPRRGLSKANQVDAALLEHRLRAELWHLEELREWAWNPTLYTGLAGGAVYGLMARDFAPVEQRLRNAAGRLEQFPRLLEQVRGVLEPSRVPKVHAETAVKQNRGVLSIVEEMVRPHAEALPAGERGRLWEAMDTARSAVEAHQRWLEGELLPRAAGDFRLGAELYDRKLAFALHSPLTRQEIRLRAEEELRRVRDEMYRIAREVYRREYPYTKAPRRASQAYQQAIIRACLETACRETPDLDGLVETARQCLARATAFVREAGLVTLPPDPVEVIVMPEFRRGVSLAYCDSPGPLDVGQKTFYAIAPPPADWTDQQVRSFLREYNLRSLTNLTVHEAMPGHFLQLAHSNRYGSKLRAMLSSGVFIEGWAIYGEHVMIERGFLDGDPLMRLIVLKWLLRAIANAILDQAIHVDGMGEEEAMELMREQTFQEEREAAGKWVRAQLTSAQLSTYFVGYLEHVALRREVEAAWGAGFDLRRYHDTLLSFGSPPTRYVRALMLDEPITA